MGRLFSDLLGVIWWRIRPTASRTRPVPSLPRVPTSHFCTSHVALSLRNGTWVGRRSKLEWGSIKFVVKTKNVMPQARTISRPGGPARYPKAMNALTVARPQLPILRSVLGEVLRDLRLSRHLTLRDVSGKAKVSLGYLSEVERGQKEASSELLASICYALNAPVSLVLREVADRIAVQEGVFVPASVPAELELETAL